MKNQFIEFDRELIKQCQTNAPRYTSYPTADRFNQSVDANRQLAIISRVFDADFNQQISLYIHIPFCNTLCLFCACNKIITNDRNKITIYLEYLAKEFALYYDLIGRKLPVIQLHFGGGSPSWLSISEVNQVMELVRKYFDLDHAHEIAMELDPRHVSDEFMENLAKVGFNRVSLGVQDFEPKVQKAVNRLQPFSDTKRVLDKAIQLGFRSTNIDLIYGLPHQTLATFSATIDRVIDELRPARIALFNYAHIPSTFMPQTRINSDDLPNADEKLNILQMSVTKLAASGYVFIGMDHFALPEDDLAIALFNGTLQRNFQGYSTFAETDMLAFGVSAIGAIANNYYQNQKVLDSYYNSLDNGQLPILRGFSLDQDDLIRRDIIGQIMCQFSLSFNTIAEKYDLDFNQYFATELVKLGQSAQLGLIEMNASGFSLSSRGRFLIRNVAMIFDKYLQQTLDNKRYSKVI